MAAVTQYTDIIDGNPYNLPSGVPTNGFREGVYDTSQATATGSTARIRALLYVWQKSTLPSAPVSATGPFYASDNSNELTKEQKDTMRLDSTSGTSNFITLLSDSGYAPDEDGEEVCSDNPGGKDPWETIIETFNYDASGGSNPVAFMRRYFPPTAANSGRSESEKLDIWQDDPDDYSTKKGDIVICSDIFHLIAPTRYNQTTNLPSFADETDYENYTKVDKAFSNLFLLVEPGGLLIFSVPYDGDPTATSGDVIEKAPFPNNVTDYQQKCHLWEWDYTLTLGTEELSNDPRNTESSTELIGDLGFTRSINCPPELRSFTRGALRALLNSAGFTSITFHPITGSMNALGIYWNATISSGEWTANNSTTEGQLASKSLIVTASRPAS